MIPPANVTLVIWPDDEMQSIIGFGGALTQASGVVWRKLNADLRRQVVELFFGEQGIHASLARVPINSCDFAEASYSLDDLPGDYTLSHFDARLPDDEEQLLPLVRAALAVAGERLQLLASPWSPPAWMKSNGDMNGNGAPRGLRPEAAAAWAKYISRWLAAFSAHGANVSWLTVQNEPLAPSPWEACYFNATQEANFIANHLGPTLAVAAATGRHPPVALLGFDDQKDMIVPWSDALLSPHSLAAEYTAGIAYHWYAGDHFDNLAKAVQAHRDKVFLGTEATYELMRLRDPTASHREWVHHGVWARGEGYAHAIIGDLLAGSSGWIDWNILLNDKGGPNHLNNNCDAPMIADVSFKEVHLHPQFYYLGHFSKFIPRGSTRVRLDRVDVDDSPSLPPPTNAGGIYNLSGSVAYGACPTGPVHAVALKRPDGRIILVALNCDDTARLIRIELGSSGRALQSTIPPRAIHTYIFAE
eukprot:CAMPEP_0119300614 /NCGR_PEP_ID=MMETSP1333-20130426/2534_1 /TAXON_ID=418940 /ORGANISM="Scyphosphaera apsteinii, Strain RCC1455" /LENGTH=473 /DNA_ID=CAMNT_0007302449 /DNA_START=361 /DNA_END=1782 /DNA_ORIENTATION=-